MRVLVTGGTGFIGSYLLRHLRADFPDETVFSLGRRDPEIPGVTHLRGDLTHEREVTDALRKASPERIYHLAGASQVTQNTPLPEYFEKNFLTTVTLIKALGKVTSPTRFFFSSSVHVYGNQRERVNETSPPHPVTAHGFTKYLAEEALRAAVSRQSQLEIVVGRFYNCIGPGQPNGFVASDLCRRLAELPNDRTSVLKVGALSSFRRFFDVRDAVRILPPLLGRPNPSRFEIFNLASPFELEIRDLLKTLMKVAKKSVPVESLETISQNPFTGLKLDVGKLENVLPGYRFRPIEETLREMFEEASRRLSS